MKLQGRAAAFNLFWGGLMTNFQRLNVALTRAKRGLVVVGSKSFWQEQPLYGEWLKWVEEQGLDWRNQSRMKPTQQATF